MQGWVSELASVVGLRCCTLLDLVHVCASIGLRLSSAGGTQGPVWFVIRAVDGAGCIQLAGLRQGAAPFCAVHEALRSCLGCGLELQVPRRLCSAYVACLVYEHRKLCQVLRLQPMRVRSVDGHEGHVKH